jgi:small subunit ribosomal protein S21
MPAIKVRENEPFDIALRRFRRLCDRAGVITDVRKKEYFEKPTWVNKRKKLLQLKEPIKKCLKIEFTVNVCTKRCI